MKDKTVAGLLALFLGGFGIQFFYLGHALMGALCVLFCWTFIPAAIGFFHGISLFLGSQEDFDKQYNPQKTPLVQPGEQNSVSSDGARYEALEKIFSLKEKGILNDEQYELEKQKLLSK